MRLSIFLPLLVTLLLAGGCTTVANPSPNSEVLECQVGEHQVCSGASASRINKGGKDPHSVCRCEPRIDQQ